MNKYFNYEGKDLWFDDRWTDHVSNVDGFVRWMGENNPFNEREMAHRDCSDPKKDPLYRPKTLSIDEPDIIKYWADRGIEMKVRSQGEKLWISMVPQKVIDAGKSGKVPALVVFHKEHYDNPWWAMRTVEFYKEYNENLAAKQDHMIIYLVTEGPDTDGIYLNILQEAFCLYPTDLDRVYADVTYPVSVGQKLSEIPDFYYFTPDMVPADPDEYIEKFGALEVPVLNIGGRWDNRDSLCRGLVMKYKMNEGRFSREAFVNSFVGKRAAEGLKMEHTFNTLYDEGFKEFWDKKGLICDINDYKGERWVAFVPKGAMEDAEDKLPVVLMMQEVYPGNEHLAISSISYCYEYTEIAAQGDAIVLFYVLEDPDSNDILVEILDEAAKMYPIDRTRVYATGHSHDGYFALKFAIHNPDVVTAVATLGNPPAMDTYEERSEPVLSYSDEEIEVLSRMELPLINAKGVVESRAVYPDDPVVYERWIRQWQRRLTAFRCPEKTLDEIRAAKQSKDSVERIYGLPFDRTESYWQDGFLHYIGDVKNKDGRYWLRFVTDENMPHTVLPYMVDVTYSFMRRFKRDPETNKIIELY